MPSANEQLSTPSWPPHTMVTSTTLLALLAADVVVDRHRVPDRFDHAVEHLCVERRVLDNARVAIDCKALGL